MKTARQRIRKRQTALGPVRRAGCLGLRQQQSIGPSYRNSCLFVEFVTMVS
jgi:hypothetical protein